MGSTAVPLLPVVTREISHGYKFKSCFNKGFCVRPKAAFLVLVWIFSVLLVYLQFYNMAVILVEVSHLSSAMLYLYCTMIIITLLSPMAGLITDLKFNRHKAIMCTSTVILIKLLLLPVLVAVFGTLYWFKPAKFTSSTNMVFILIYGGLAVLIPFYIVFIINSIQFGLDQLQAASTEDFIVFLHWYVWIYYTCSFITELSWNTSFYEQHFSKINEMRAEQMAGFFLTGCIIVTSSILMTISLCIVKLKKRRWFEIEPVGPNPLKLVFKVTSFVCRHKIPLNRSAFTYCDEELPLRMDVGKQKYGGPFTTKEVEDVRAFWSILVLLVVAGSAFLMQTVTQSLLPAFAKHGNLYTIKENLPAFFEVHLEGPARHIMISNGLLSPLLVVVCIPIYLCFIRQHITYRVPGTLKRIALGMAIMLLSLLSTLVMDSVVHVERARDAHCMFYNYTVDKHWYTHKFDVINGSEILPPPPLYQNAYFFTCQHVLSALANMITEIALLEFICSQSPHSMKGSLLGAMFSIRNFYQAIGFLFILPFTAWRPKLLSCGSSFYALMLVMGILSFLAFVCITKRYKYREVSEPQHEYRYAEEYYSNIPQRHA